MSTIEKYSCYEFEIKSHMVPGFEANSDTFVKGYYYVIYDPDYIANNSAIIRECDEYFDTEQEARLAAIGHITLLENGEG